MTYFFPLLILSYFTFLSLVKAAEDSSEDFYEPKILSVLNTNYSTKDIEIKINETVGRYTSHNDGKEITENSERLLYEDNSLKPLGVSSDGRREFVEEQEIKSHDMKSSQTLASQESACFDGNKMDRVEMTNTAPYRFLGSLLITFPHAQHYPASKGCICIGTGVLIGPNHVLTAGHNVYDFSRGGWASSIIFTPAQHKSFKPFGDSKGVSLRTFKGWINRNKDSEDYDMGVVILDNSIGYQSGWMSLLDPSNAVLDENPSLTIAGYPDKTKHIKIKKVDGIYKMSSARMFKHSSNLGCSKLKRLHYRINTLPGQSGSPIIYSTNNTYFVLGIHTHGAANESDLNSGTRLTPKKFDRILEGVRVSIIPEIKMGPSDDEERVNIEEHSIDNSQKTYKDAEKIQNQDEKLANFLEILESPESSNKDKGFSARVISKIYNEKGDLGNAHKYLNIALSYGDEKYRQKYFDTSNIRFAFEMGASYGVRRQKADDLK